MTTDEGPLTIIDAAKRIRSGELTPSSLLEICLARIDRYEPRVRAWVYIDRERARKEAEQLTKELKEGLDRGPLHGIPIGIKDIIDVYDMPTGCGSKLWANSYARKDATCVERLRQAGALILGKTVTTPYAYLDPPVTRNPWNLDRTPGGSSSGSAAAVACGMCLGALATQTGGSTIRPAAYCGVCALKPTYGRVSVDGVLPLAPSLDHVGVMANCVRDLATLFQVIAGYDPDALYTRALPVPDCIRAVDREIAQVGTERHLGEPANRRRFLRPAEMFPDTLSPEISKLMRRVERDLSTLADARATVEQIVFPADFLQVHETHRLRMAAGAARTHFNRFRRHPEDYPPRISELIEYGLSMTREDYERAEHSLGDLSWRVMQSYSGEPLITPATIDTPPTAETTGNPWCNSPWSFLGLPTITIPLGWASDGLPMGVQFVGHEYREDSFLARSAWVEAVFRLNNATKPRVLPPVP